MSNNSAIIHSTTRIMGSQNRLCDSAAIIYDLSLHTVFEVAARLYMLVWPQGTPVQSHTPPVGRLSLRVLSLTASILWLIAAMSGSYLYLQIWSMFYATLGFLSP
jgi:hypothetical protein